jgi:cysteine desulfurase
MPRRIYFDHAATTPLDARVRAAMGPYLESEFGNPSSLHAEGRAARAAVEEARRHVAHLVGAQPGHVIFTSGGTEASNLALAGVAADGGRGHLVVSAIEHPAVRETCRALARRGVVDVTSVGVDGDGAVAPEAVRAALRPDTRLISVMAANNVTGVLQPVGALAEIARGHGCLFHTDAVQAAGKLPLDMERDGIDLLSLSAHKLHGPQGVGALIARRGAALTPILHGGGQERGLRSGTENVAAIVGFGAAAWLAAKERSAEAVRLIALRDRLIAGITAAVPEAYLIGHAFRRLPGHVCVGLAGLEGESITLMLALDEAGFAVSTGSACSAHKASEPSYVLQAMGFDAFRARGALRITLGRASTAEEVDSFLNTLPRVVARLRPITTRAARAVGV